MIVKMGGMGVRAGARAVVVRPAYSCWDHQAWRINVTGPHLHGTSARCKQQGRHFVNKRRHRCVEKNHVSKLLKGLILNHNQLNIILSNQETRRPQNYQEPTFPKFGVGSHVSSR